MAEGSPARASNDELLSGQFVLHTLITEFIAQVDKKVDHLLNNQLKNSQSLTKDNLAKSLQRGEDPQFDQLLCSLGCVAEYCLPCLLETLLGWYNHQIPDKKTVHAESVNEKVQKLEWKGKNDSKQVTDYVKDRYREFAVEFVFCLVLIEILKQIPVHPLPDSQIRSILSKAFNSFHASAHPKDSDVEISIIADLYAEMIGVLAQTKFLAVHHKFMYELLKKDTPANTLISLIMGMKYFRVKMFPVEDFEASFRFMQELANFSLESKNRDVKNALAGMFVEVLIPVSAAVKTEVNVPVLRDFVDSLYPTSLELSKRAKNKPVIFPLVTCLLCVSQKTFFLNNWHIFLDICLSTLKKSDSRLSRVALESLYRLLWVYMVRIKCESNTTTQARLQSIVKNLFPTGSRNVVPKDMPINIFVKIVQFIALERLDFAMREIISDLLATTGSSSRAAKPVTLYPERMNIGLRAFLVITDSLQQKDGAPPMPSTMNVMPSGNTIRVKKTFLNKTLTEDDARSIGVLHYLRQVQRALAGILLSLDSQVGMKLLQTNTLFHNKDPHDFITSEQKPKIELFRTCVAALPRLMPHGIPHGDLLDIVCRLTIHVDDDLRSRAIAALQAFIIDFPVLSEEVVASFVSFVQSQVSDIHQDLLNNSLKIASSLVGTWRTSIVGAESNKSPKKQLKKSEEKAQSPSPISPTQSRCTYASVINRLEGFAIVYLCSSRNLTRKLSCHLLKEVRSLAGVLDYNKPEEQLCLDVLDQLCPEVSAEVTKEEKYFKRMGPHVIEAILSTGCEREFSSLVELSCNWMETEGVHPWIYFMVRFIDVSRLQRTCSRALLYSWPDAYIRASQIQKYIEPFMTSGSKKVTSAPLVSGDQILILWTHYLILLCRSALSNTSVKQRRNEEAAVPAGTPDWKVKLIRDGKILDAVPSTLFQKMIGIVRSDLFPPAYKESVVLGLGFTSTAAFYDLLCELQHVIHEGGESKKQENVRRRRKRENIRIFLIKLFSNLAIHETLSKGIYKQVDKLPESKKIPKEVIQEYVSDTQMILDSLDRSESALITSFSSQQYSLSSPFGQTASALNSAGIKEEMKLNFADIVINLVKYYRVSSRLNLLPQDAKRRLFLMFSSWYDKYLKDKERHPNNSYMDCAKKMLSARCSVMCCGPIFDEAGLAENGYLYDYLEFLLNSGDVFTRQLGQESIVMLLHFNPNLLQYQSWIFEKCYTSSDTVARACFLGLASAYANANFNGTVTTILTLSLFYTADSDAEVSQTAELLLNSILSKDFVKPVEERLGGTMSSGTSFQNNIISRKSSIIKSATSSRSHSRLKVTEDLARSHQELTHSILSEIFMRLPRADDTKKRRLLKVIHPWLQNVELIPVGDYDSEHSEGESCCDHKHPCLPGKGWGTNAATLHVLSNVMYLTTHYHRYLEDEIQTCWSVLCGTWQANLFACMQYLTALYSVESRDLLRNAIRQAVTYISKANGARVLSTLIEQCLRSEPVDVTVEPCVDEPCYKVVAHNPKFEGDSPAKKSCESSSNAEIFSDDTSECFGENKSQHSNSGAEQAKIENKDSFKASVALRRVTARSSRPNFRLSLQIPGSDKTGAMNQSLGMMSKRSPMLSSSMMSLTKTSDQGMSGEDSGLLRFNTISPGRPAETDQRFSGFEALTNKNSAKLASPKDRRSSSPLRKAEHNSGLSRSNASTKDSSVLNATIDGSYEISELLMWLEHHCTDKSPKPLPLPSSSFHLPLHKLIVCNPVDGLMYSNISCIFLSQLITSRSLDINWNIHLPLVSLALILNMDDTDVLNVPFYCKQMLAHIILILARDKIPKDLIRPILSYSLESCDTILGSSRDTIPCGGEIVMYKLSEKSMLESSLSSDGFVEDAVKRILTELVLDSTKMWNFEDVGPKAIVLKSTERLARFVTLLADIVERCSPLIKFKQRLASEAAKLTVATPHKHRACRALQVFRALELPLATSVFSKLIRCLAGRIAYGVDTDNQSHVIEILLTLVHDCDIGSSTSDGSPVCKVSEKIEPVNAGLFGPNITADRTQSDKERKQPRSPTPGRVLTFPGSPKRSAPAQFSVHVPGHAGQNTVNGKQADAPNRGRKVHAHRRSGSVTLTKKMTSELLSSAASHGGFNVSSKSVPELRPNFAVHEPSETLSLAPRSPLHTKSVDASPVHDVRRILQALSPSTSGDHAKTSTNKDAGDVFVPSDVKSSGAKERDATFAQMFWIGIAMLESDYEHEYLLALQLLERVLSLLPLDCKENRTLIERYLTQINWTSFPGVQSLLLKGLTSSATFNPTFRLLSSLTIHSHLQLVSGSRSESHGFAMNVVALLPSLLDSFTDPDYVCSSAARSVADVCSQRYSREKKLQSLAHVMLLYSSHTYGQSSTIWISVVSKYIHETFPDSIREQLDFLLGVLDRGPSSVHQSCLRIVHSLLFLSELLLSNEQSDVAFHQNILKTVSKFVNNTKLWKDALQILKLAVSRSSAITTPTVSSSMPPISDSDRISLPGRTLTFKFNLSDTPIIGRRKNDDQLNKKSPFAGSPTYHPSTASMIVSSWKKPMFSQKRTYERMSCIAQICGKHLVVAKDSAPVLDPPAANEMAEKFREAAKNNGLEEQDGNDADRNDDGDSSSSENGDDNEVAGSGVDDFVVLRNFDFLDEFDDNDDGFTTGYQKSQAIHDGSNMEDDPIDCNLTPVAHRDSMPEADPTQSEDYSDLSDTGEADVTSHTSGVLSQSWNGNKSHLTEMGSTEFYSSLVTISSAEKPEMPRVSSCESINKINPLSRYNLQSRRTQSEMHLNKKASSSSESLKSLQFDKTDELDENDTSDTETNHTESDIERCDASSRPTLLSKDFVEDEYNEKYHDDLMSSLVQLTTPPPPISESPDFPLNSDGSASARDIPIVEPPPVTNDITSNLSAVPFGLPVQFVSVASANKSESNNKSTSSGSDPVAYQDTIFTAWKLHLASIGTTNDSAFVAKTFDLFPTVFKVLCVDFSAFSKNGCTYLGGQLSKIAEHFSSMVEQLPSQIKCPRCLASETAIDPVAERVVEGIHVLQEHFEAYNAKRKSAVECIGSIKEIECRNGRGSIKSQGIGHKQLELCRLLYRLHYQLLLLLKCFNQLIRVLASGTNENGKNITDQLESLKKKVSTIEKTYQTHRDKQDAELRLDLKSRTVGESEQALMSSIANDHLHLAIRQLYLLRRLWPAQYFGHVDQPAGDFLVKMYFNHLEQQGDEKIYAILGSEQASHDVCEKLMEVNGQIQQSLDSLALNAGDINTSPALVKKTHF